jgi:hypothetical protein
MGLKGGWCGEGGVRASSAWVYMMHVNIGIVVIQEKYSHALLLVFLPVVLLARA